MASTQQVARAAAQLHEAAQEVAQVAARRSARNEGQAAEPLIPPQLAEDRAGLTPDGHDEPDCSPAGIAGPGKGR